MKRANWLVSTRPQTFWVLSLEKYSISCRSVIALKSTTVLAQELQNEAQDFLKDLGLFKKKVGSDVERFGARELLHDLISV